MKTSIIILPAIIMMAAAPLSRGQDSSGIPVSKTSSFTATEGLQNPFLPIGWAGGPVVAAPVAMAINPGMFKITSILLGNPSLVVINGREYEEGEEVHLPGGATGVVVGRIRDGEVVLRQGKAEVAVTLDRE